MRQLWTDEAFRRLALMALAGILAVAMAVRFVADYRAGRIQELCDRYEAKWMEYERYTRLLANRDMYVKMQADLDN